jgi:multiple antibiotic resistance protein
MLRSDTSHSQTPDEAADSASRGQIAIVPLAIIALATIVGALFAFFRPIAIKLGKSGMGVVTRVMAMILTAIAMSMLADGVRGMLPVLAS